MKSPIDWRFETLENAVDCVFESAQNYMQIAERFGNRHLNNADLNYS